jgi:hypothetical protein
MSDINDKSAGLIPNHLGSLNRGNDTVTKTNELPAIKMTLEMINSTLMDYLTTVIGPTINDNETVRSVPVLYGIPERWATVRKDGFLRDPQNDKLLTPAIMLTRTTVKQSKLVNPNNKYMHRTVTREWNNRNVYDRYALQNGIRPSLKIRNVIIPDYMDLTYDVIMWTEYQQQMDTLIEQINVENHEFWGNRNAFKFAISIEEFQGNNELPPSGDRVVRTRFQMNVQAYLLPEKVIQNFKLASTNKEEFTKKKIIVTETIVNDL